MEIRVGSKWHGSDYNEFVVEAVKRLDGDVWVHYAKTGKFGVASEQKYSCLDGAFLHRFRPSVE